MKTLVIGALIWAVIIGGSIRSGIAEAQQAVPQTDPLTVGCSYATALAAKDRLTVAWCRKVAVVQEGNSALVTVQVKVPGQGRFTVGMQMYQTTWDTQTVTVLPAGG